LSQGSVVSARLNRITQHSAFRYLVAGGLSFSIDEFCLFVLHGLFHVWLPAATVLAFVLAFGVNFQLNRSWAFAAGGGGAVGRQAGRYGLLVAANLATTTFGVPGLTAAGVYYLISKAVVSGVLVVINYVVSRRWIFVPAASGEPGPPGRPQVPRRRD
jgi:putative flippase GtrA